MNCPECERLYAERDRRERALATATAIMNAAATSDDSAEYMRLRAVANEARLDLSLVEAEIARHPDRHP